MPQIQSLGTSNSLACFQGFLNGGGALVTRAAWQCTLTQLTTYSFKLQINQWLDDEDMSIKVCVLDGQSPVPTQKITWNTDGSATITFQLPGGDIPSGLGLFNIWVTQCTDFVTMLEGPPGNP